MTVAYLGERLAEHQPYRWLHRCQGCKRRWPCGPWIYARDELSRLEAPGGTAAEQLTGWGATRAAGTYRNNGQTRSLTPGSTVRP